METWTEDHWKNLEAQAHRILQLLETRKRDLPNKAWRATLRIAINTVADFEE